MIADFFLPIKAQKTELPQSVMSIFVTQSGGKKHYHNL